MTFQDRKFRNPGLTILTMYQKLKYHDNVRHYLKIIPYDFTSSTHRSNLPRLSTTDFKFPAFQALMLKCYVLVFHNQYDKMTKWNKHPPNHPPPPPEVETMVFEHLKELGFLDGGLLGD